MFTITGNDFVLETHSHWRGATVRIPNNAASRRKCRQRPGSRF